MSVPYKECTAAIPDSESHCADRTVGASPLGGKTVFADGVIGQAATPKKLGLHAILTYILSLTKRVR